MNQDECKLHFLDRIGFNDELWAWVTLPPVFAHKVNKCPHCGFSIKGGTMQVQLKNNIFTATQWFKDGDHPAVHFFKNSMYGPYYKISTVYDYDGQEQSITPGMWIVEMFDGIHLYSDEEFHELFMEYKPIDFTIYKITNSAHALPAIQKASHERL